MILSQNILFLNRFLARNGCFGLFTKIKKRSGTRFWCKFSTRFFHKNLSYLILYQLAKFQYDTMFKCVIKFLFRQLKTSKTLRFYIIEGKIEMQNFEYLKNEKSFLHEIKSTFHNHLKAII